MPQHAQDRSAPVARLTTLERDGGQRIALRLEGAWRLPVLPQIDEGLRSLALPPTVIIDGTDLTEIDSAAALTLLRRLDRAGIDPLRVRLVEFTPGCLRIIEQVRAHLGEIEARRITHRAGSLESLGRRVVAWKDDVAGYLNFIGAVAVRTARTVIHPRSLRVKELAVQFERVCIEAVGVVSLVTLLIGVVITYHLYVGLTKAPVLGTVIAIIGCRMGMTVGRDTRAVGKATTSTVVLSLVWIIFLDAGFAVIFQVLDI